MNKFFVKNAKIIYFALGILGFLVLIGVCLFMTQYRYIRIYYGMDTVDGKVIYKYLDSSRSGSTSSAEDQTALFDFIGNYASFKDYGFLSGDPITYIASDGTSQTAVLSADQIEILEKIGTFGKFNSYGEMTGLADGIGDTIRIFRDDLDAYNDLLIVYAVFIICAFAVLLIFSNHTRKVYYVSNIIVGILAPLAVIVFTVIVIIQGIGLMNRLQENIVLYNTVSTLQTNSLKSIGTIFLTPAQNKDQLSFIAKFFDNYNVNSTTFIVYFAIFGVVALYSAFLAIYSIIRYKGCAEHRAEVLKRAGVKND